MREKLTIKEKLLVVFFGVIIFYLCSMIDMRPLTTERWVDCRVGDHIFTLMAKDCK